MSIAVKLIRSCHGSRKDRVCFTGRCQSTNKDHESEQIMATRFVLGRVKSFNCSKLSFLTSWLPCSLAIRPTCHEQPAAYWHCQNHVLSPRLISSFPKHCPRRTSAATMCPLYWSQYCTHQWCRVHLYISASVHQWCTDEYWNFVTAVNILIFKELPQATACVLCTGPHWPLQRWPWFIVGDAILMTRDNWGGLTLAPPPLSPICQALKYRPHPTYGHLRLSPRT